MDILYLILAAVIIGPIALAAALMWRRPKCRLPLARIATATLLMFWCAALFMNIQANGREVTTHRVNMDIFGQATFSGLERLGDDLLCAFFVYLGIESLGIALIGFVWSRLRPLGIGRGVVVEESDMRNEKG